MDASEPVEEKDERKQPHVSIKIDSPSENRIVSGDYIEFNIHVTHSGGASAAERSEELENLVRAVAQAWPPKETLQALRRTCAECRES